MRRSVQLTRVLLAAALVAVAAAACGSSKSKSTTSTTPTHSATTRTTAPSASPTTATTSTVTTGPVHVVLKGQNHAPVAGKSWTYTVHVTNASGAPLSGTVETDFVVAGLGVVGKETPAVHRLKNGVLRDDVTFPPAAIGHPISLVTVVHTSAGSVAVGWPVSVAK